MEDALWRRFPVQGKKVRAKNAPGGFFLGSLQVCLDMRILLAISGATFYGVK